MNTEKIRLEGLLSDAKARLAKAEIEELFCKAAVEGIARRLSKFQTP